MYRNKLQTIQSLWWVDWQKTAKYKSELGIEQHACLTSCKVNDYLLN